jgi:hypothetical protein
VQLQPPGSQRALGAGARQNHGGGLVEQAPQMGIATSRDMPIVIDLTGLVAACGQPEPGTDRS